MCRIGAILSLVVFGACSHPEAQTVDSPIVTTGIGTVPVTRLSFEDVAIGGRPAGWKLASTGEETVLATWEVVANEPPSPAGRALALTKTNHDSGSAFNLCWTDEIRFEDGAIELSMKPVSGDEDQGGGPIWRVKDKDNYYVCRANPLEENFRLYVVKDGKRKQLASAAAEIATGDWHTIRVEHEGPRIACWLGGKKLLEASDTAFPEPGGVGFWTKADAVTSFDDLHASSGIEAKIEAGR